MTTTPQRAVAAPGQAGWAVPMGAADRRRILVAGDVVVLGLLVIAALRIGAVRSGWQWGAGFLLQHAAWPIVIVGLWMGLAWANGLYDARRAPDRWLAVLLSAKVSAQLLVIWAVAYFLPPPWTLVRHVAVFFAAGAALFMPLWRVGYAEAFRREGFKRRVLIAGAGRAGRTVLDVVRREVPHEYDVVGFVDDDPALADGVVDDVPVLGGSSALAAAAVEVRATEVVLAVTRDMGSALFAAVMDAREQGLVVTPMAVFYEEATGRVPVEHIGDQWAVALPLDPPEARGLYRLFKRTADVALGVAGLALLALAVPFLALAIVADSGRPVLYRQRRVGRAGVPFTLIKLRTMVPDAESDGPRWASPDDARVTRVGRWLRRTRLDELPQFVNVVRGDMSVVGPRPERPEFVDRLAGRIPFYKARHAVRPGLTGWATVNLGYGDSEADALEKLQYDLYYIKHQSVLLDATILLRTAATVLSLRGR